MFSYVFKGDISAEVPIPTAGISESSFFRGTESWLLFKGTSAKENRDLDTTHTAYGIFWPKVDQSSKYQSTIINLPLAVVLLQLLQREIQ